jgi:hypothetical protein
MNNARVSGDSFRVDPTTSASRGHRAEGRWIAQTPLERAEVGKVQGSEKLRANKNGWRYWIRVEFLLTLRFRRTKYKAPERLVKRFISRTSYY